MKNAPFDNQVVPSYEIMDVPQSRSFSSCRWGLQDRLLEACISLAVPSECRGLVQTCRDLYPPTNPMESSLLLMSLRGIVLLVLDTIDPSWMEELVSPCLSVAEKEGVLSNTLDGWGVAAGFGDAEAHGTGVHGPSKVVVSDSFGIVESDPTVVVVAAFVMSTILVETLSSHDFVVAFPVPFR